MPGRQGSPVRVGSQKERHVVIFATLQARMSSRRLPGKVMRPLLGEPMIGRRIARVRRSRRMDRLVVATSDRADEDVLAAYCATLEVPVFRGSLTDVLARFHAAARTFGPAETIVRQTATTRRLVGHRRGDRPAPADQRRIHQ